MLTYKNKKNTCRKNTIFVYYMYINCPQKHEKLCTQKSQEKSLERSSTHAIKIIHSENKNKLVFHETFSKGACLWGEARAAPCAQNSPRGFGRRGISN